MNSNSTFVIPNTFVIGAQKSATTSIYDWIAQHPDACGPLSLKDSPIYFTDDTEAALKSAYSEYIAHDYSYETKVVLQGWVQYLYYPEALLNIRKNSPKAKLIVVLRNPTDRAISAYRFFKKLGREHLSLEEALEREPERQTGSFAERNDLTYVSHGLYASQLKNALAIFERDEIFITLYDEIQTRPQKVIRDLYDFLGLDAQFQPTLAAQNVTGIQKFSWIDKALSTPSPTRKFIVRHFVDRILPVHKRTSLRWKLRSWNTIPVADQSLESFSAERKVLRAKFRQEIIELEEILGISLEKWK